jgi:hypothetical protein
MALGRNKPRNGGGSLRFTCKWDSTPLTASFAELVGIRTAE